MTRIFATLALLSLGVTATAFWLGLEIGDPTLRDPGVQRQVAEHMLTGLAALIFATLVHALVLTYFMGTGRWLDETCSVYQLPRKWCDENRSLKYRTIPWMALCLLLLIAVGGLGGAADPAASLGFREWRGIPSATLHMTAALAAWGLNLCVHLWQFLALRRNGELIEEVIGEVRRIRRENGLPE